jgi:hypothetical protein
MFCEYNFYFSQTAVMQSKNFPSYHFGQKFGKTLCTIKLSIFILLSVKRTDEQIRKLMPSNPAEVEENVGKNNTVKFTVPSEPFHHP